MSLQYKHALAEKPVKETARIAILPEGGIAITRFNEDEAPPAYAGGFLRRRMITNRTKIHLHRAKSHRRVEALCQVMMEN